MLPSADPSCVSSTFLRAFSGLVDPRRVHLRRYELSDLILLAITGVLAGCESWDEIADYGKARKSWFQDRLGRFPHGMPSHDTIGRVFRLLDSTAFAQAFARWVDSVLGQVLGVIAIDGKTSRGSRDGAEVDPIHTVSAFAADYGLTLAHVAVESGKTESTTIPQVLSMLALQGTAVTIDAIGCQHDIVAAIRDRKGDYLLSVKGNQPTLLQEISEYFVAADDCHWQGMTHTTATLSESGHGRKEIRTAWACPVNKPWLADWTGIAQIVRIRNERTVKGKTTINDSYYITSSHREAGTLLKFKRQHWGIENRVHWVLDVAFTEDRSRVRKDHAAHNFVTLRRLALNILRRQESKKGLNRRRRMAGYETKCLEEILLLTNGSVTQ